MKRDLSEDKAAFFGQIVNAIEKQERLREATDETVLLRAEKMILFLKDSLGDLRSFVDRNEFLDSQEEIAFFKGHLPSILRYFIFYVKVYSLELRLLILNDPAKKKLLKRERKEIDKWIGKNEGFFRFYKSGTSELDNKYFRKSSKDMSLITDPGQWLFDDKFITVPSYLIGELLAYQRYRTYLENELRIFSGSLRGGVSLEEAQDDLVWTATKMAAVEILYGLYSVAAFNNGNAQLRQIARRVEKLTGIDLGNYYRYSIDLKIKKVRNEFLKKMIDSSEKRMDEQDENGRHA